MKQQYFSQIKNPMTIIALFVGLTEIGFGLAFSRAPESLQSPFLYFMMGFPVLVCIGFFLILFFRHQHLFGPGDFRSDEAYLAASRGITAVETFAKIAGKPDKEPKSASSSDVLRAVISSLGTPLCWYLLKVANRSMTLKEHLETLAEEIGLDHIAEATGFDMTSSAFGYFFSLGNFADLLWDISHEELEITFQMFPEALRMIAQRLHPEMASS